MARTRFAPSPTGLLHLGHAYSAWFAYEAGGGQYCLRLEDIDQTRARQEFEAAIFQDLTDLGLPWSGEVVRQSQRLPLYQGALNQLLSLDLLYRCACSRREVSEISQAPHGPDGPIYPGTCRGRSIDPSQPFVWRLDMSRARKLTGNLTFHEVGLGDLPAQADQFGDVVLARKDAGFSYHLCVVVDDAEQGFDLITRGQDLRAASGLHRLLQELLGLPVPAWHHHGLVCDDQGKRLAKRHDALSLRSFLDQGVRLAEIIKLAEQSLGND